MPKPSSSRTDTAARTRNFVETAGSTTEKHCDEIIAIQTGLYSSELAIGAENAAVKSSEKGDVVY
jgi:hypothetical protein